MKNIKLICPKCNKKLEFKFPYNLDLFRNDVMIECKCGQKIKIDFIDNSLFGTRLQMIFKNNKEYV